MCNGPRMNEDILFEEKLCTQSTMNDPRRKTQLSDTEQRLIAKAHLEPMAQLS